MTESNESRSILVTGGAGFIGSAVVRALLERTTARVVNVDKLTYAASIESLSSLGNDPRYAFERVDICDRGELERVFREHRPAQVMHLAAESHVDRSICGPDAFVETNIVGTFTLLEVSRTYCQSLEPGTRDRFRFHHVSTDEVYGDLGPDDPPFSEDDRYAPSSPYSATKASADHLVRAWHRTYGLPVVLTNCSNNYGPFQFPEKLIPLVIVNALEDEPLPVYGKGDNVRDWLYVEDHADALIKVLHEGRLGRTYNIGGGSERTNLEVVRSVCAELDAMAPSEKGPYERLITFVDDRPGHDRRYAIDDSRIRTELGWRPAQTFETGLKRTVEWYLSNWQWVERVRNAAYRRWLKDNYGRRLGSTP